MAVISILLLTKFFLLVPTSYAIITCPNTPAFAELFFDLDTLKIAQVDHREIFQAPVQCAPGGHTGCEQQICCGDEVGCCHTDPTTKKGWCGCKARDESTCDPAPFAYIKGSACESHSSRSISMCLKKVKYGSPDVRGFIFKDSDLYPEIEVKTERGALTVNINGLALQLQGDFHLIANGHKATQYLKTFSAEMLVDMLEPSVFAELVALAKAKKKHGL